MRWKDMTPHGRRDRRSVPLTAVLAIVSTAPAAAEVMDKQPRLPEIWVSAVVIAVVAFLAGRRHPLLGVVALFVSCYTGNWALYALDGVEDPDWGRAILAEAGRSYIVQTYLACLLELVGAAAGSTVWLVRRWKEWRHGQASPATAAHGYRCCGTGAGRRGFAGRWGREASRRGGGRSRSRARRSSLPSRGRRAS